MPTTTRASAQDDFKHIVQEAMGQAENSPIWRALVRHDYVEVPDLIMMQEEDINSLSYQDEEGNEVPLIRLHGNLIRIFQAFEAKRRQGGEYGDF